MTDPAWRDRKIRDLCDERHPILSRKREGAALPNDATLLKHIHRELDFYEMQEAQPGFDMMRDRLRQSRNLLRRIQRALARAATLASTAPKP